MTALHSARPFVTSLETYSGLYIDYCDPQPEHIALADIARGLAQVCRFAGQTTKFYSVAEHAVYVRRLVLEQESSHELALAALHHDSHEAYLGDWPSPLKYVMGSERYSWVKRAIDRAIAAKFGFDSDLLSNPLIKQCDIEAMRHEAATFKWSHGTGSHWGWDDAAAPLAGVGWMPDRAEREFMRAHQEELWHWPT